MSFHIDEEYIGINGIFAEHNDLFSFDEARNEVKEFLSKFYTWDAECEEFDETEPKNSRNYEITIKREDECCDDTYSTIFHLEIALPTDNDAQELADLLDGEVVSNKKMKTYLIRISIKDADGQHEYDYSNDFLVDIDTEEITAKEGTNKFYKQLFKAFKPKIKQAALDWFAKDPEAIKADLEQYGTGYDYEPDPDGKETEADYIVDNFPPRSIAHIPDEIMEANGFKLAPEPSLDQEFYDDLGFLND